MLNPLTATRNHPQRPIREEGEKLTSTINQPQLLPNPMRTERTPVRHEIDTPRGLPDPGPVLSPRRPLKRRHERGPVHPTINSRVLEGINQLDHLLGRPLPLGRHVERQEEVKVGALVVPDGRGRGVGLAQLSPGVGVRGPDVEGESVDTAGLGGEDLVGPVLLGVAVCQADLFFVWVVVIISSGVGRGMFFGRLVGWAGGDDGG